MIEDLVDCYFNLIPLLLLFLLVFLLGDFGSRSRVQRFASLLLSPQLLLLPLLQDSANEGAVRGAASHLGIHLDGLI